MNSLVTSLVRMISVGVVLGASLTYGEATAAEQSEDLYAMYKETQACFKGIGHPVGATEDELFRLLATRMSQETREYLTKVTARRERWTVH